MEIGIGLDTTLGLSYEQQASISEESASLGYTSVWTPDGPGEDAFLLCLLRWQATRIAHPGGLTTGIGVSPVGLRSPMGLAMSAGTLSKLTGGRFVLGVGSGAAQTPEYRSVWDIRGSSVLGLMRDYLNILRGLLAGDTVRYEGKSVSMRGGRLGIDPPPQTPVYLGGLGPEMLRLGGEVADGICLNWCKPEQVAWSREQVRAGAARSGRDPSQVKIAEYIRVCVDDDVEVARQAFTRALMVYALGRLDAPPQGYRAHFERMGFAAVLSKVDDLRRRNAPQQEIVDALPGALLEQLGYYGPAAGAAAAVTRLSQGLDTAIVRVVAARPGIEATRAAMLACAPSVR